MFIVNNFFSPLSYLKAVAHSKSTLAAEVAERIRSIGHYAPATLREYLQLTHLTEKSSQPNDHKGFIGDLLTSHESIIMNLRRHIVSVDQDLHDAGTSDFITGVMAAHEKMAWILRSHLTE